MHRRPTIAPPTINQSASREFYFVRRRAKLRYPPLFFRPDRLAASSQGCGEPRKAGIGRLRHHSILRVEIQSIRDVAMGSIALSAPPGDFVSEAMVAPVKDSDEVARASHQADSSALPSTSEIRCRRLRSCCFSQPQTCSPLCALASMQPKDSVHGA